MGSNDLTFSTIEALEERKLLSAALVGGTLEIDGNSKNNSIQISFADRKYQVREGKKLTVFSARRVKSITINGGPGHDTIVVLGRMRAPLSVEGAEGNDTITGGSANEMLRGGAGNDLIIGGAGNDQIHGDAGDDALYGDSGDDSLYGGDGNDTLGGDDEDMLYTGVNHSHTEGNDLLDGGAGDDWLLGGTGNQTIHDPNGRDTLSGGEGADVLDARGGDDVILDKTSQDMVPTRDVVPARERPGDIHTHADIQIRVRKPGGADAIAFIPALIGHFLPVSSGLHTHVDSNQPEGDRPANFSRIHYEAPAGSRGYTLRDFFRLWGVTFSSRNLGRLFASSTRSISMTVNGRVSTEYGNYAPRDADKIVITVG